MPACLPMASAGPTLKGRGQTGGWHERRLGSWSSAGICAPAVCCKATCGATQWACLLTCALPTHFPTSRPPLTPQSPSYFATKNCASACAFSFCINKLGSRSLPAVARYCIEADVANGDVSMPMQLTGVPGGWGSAGALQLWAARQVMPSA